MKAETQAMLIEFILSSEQFHKNAELLEVVKDLAHGLSYRTRSLDRALDEWLEKSDWIQEYDFHPEAINSRDGGLGMHRMDIANNYIKYLEKENERLTDEIRGYEIKEYKGDRKK